MAPVFLLLVLLVYCPFWSCNACYIAYRRQKVVIVVFFPPFGGAPSLLSSFFDSLAFVYSWVSCVKNVPPERCLLKLVMWLGASSWWWCRSWKWFPADGKRKIKKNWEREKRNTQIALMLTRANTFESLQRCPTANTRRLLETERGRCTQFVMCFAIHCYVLLSMQWHLYGIVCFVCAEGCNSNSNSISISLNDSNCLGRLHCDDNKSSAGK